MSNFVSALITLWYRSWSVMTVPTVSTCNTCQRVVGEFCVGACVAYSGANIAQSSSRTWPAIWELGQGDWPDGVGFTSQTSISSCGDDDPPIPIG